jgi:hypothetical protein
MSNQGNKMEDERDRWRLIALHFVKSCEIDGFGDVRLVHLGQATRAYNMFNELLVDLEHESTKNEKAVQ